MYSAIIVQNDSSISEVWIADSGASCHMTHKKSDMYGIRPPTPVVKPLQSGKNVALRLNVSVTLALSFTGTQTYAKL